MFLRSTLALLLLLATLGVARPFGGPGQPFNEVRTRKEAQIVALVRENFFDAKMAEAWADSHKHFATEASDDGAFAALARRALADLATSHTGYFDRHDPEYYGLRSIFSAALKFPGVEWDGPGADFTPDNFVRVVFAGGPADRAGLRRGDRISSADGKPFHRVDSFQGRAGQPVTLRVQRQKDGEPITVTLTPRRVNPMKEWLEAQVEGSRLLDVGGRKVGYVPMFACTGDTYLEALQETLGQKLRQADALVLDFRDGWGGCSPSFVNLFTRAAPPLTYIDRKGREQVLDTQWRKPVVLLLNRGSRSGKEAVADALKRHRLATLVGERSAGAVVAGRCFRLSDDSLLYLAVSDIRVQGRRLEGVGVEPDVPVPDSLPFAGGRDPQKEKALELAAQARGG